MFQAFFLFWIIIMWIFCLLWILVMWIILYHLFIHILLFKICFEGSNYMDWHTIWYYESISHRRWNLVNNPDTFEIFVTEWFCKNIFKLCIILDVQTCTIHSISHAYIDRLRLNLIFLFVILKSWPY